MGRARVELMPPAVLYRNPGVTKEEYVELLEEIPYHQVTEYEPEDNWDEIKTDRYLIEEGLEDLATILGLEKSDDFKEFKREEMKRDENDLIVKPPETSIRFNDNSKRYVVKIHMGNDIIEDGIVEETVLDGIEEGEGRNIFGRSYKVREIFEKEKVSESDFRSEWRCKMDALVYEPEFEKEVFENKEELWEEWPQFHPENQYDWEQEGGEFYFFGEWGDPSCFLWEREDGKFYFDDETFDQIPASAKISKGNKLGYTDFVLTLEGLKRNAWKLFSHRGHRNYLSDFLEDFPNAKERHDKAVWDFYTSKHAKNKSMTIRDFISQIKESLVKGKYGYRYFPSK